MKEKYLPKISVLIPSFNQGKYIEENIQSVLNQNYPNFEHIIIGGGSSDNTVGILKKYPHLIWVSEPDEGQSDALNKGVDMATGDIIGWINSDVIIIIFSKSELNHFIYNAYTYIPHFEQGVFGVFLSQKTNDDSKLCCWSLHASPPFAPLRSAFSLDPWRMPVSVCPPAAH